MRSDDHQHNGSAKTAEVVVVVVAADQSTAGIQTKIVPPPQPHQHHVPAETQSDDDNSSDTVTVPPPDGGWGWMVVFGSFMIHIITDGVTYSFGVFYDEYLTYFNEGKGATAWILSILVGVTLCSGPISSSLVNRWGCRLVTIAGAILASICMVISTFAQNVTTLYFTIGLGTGFGFGLIYLPAIVSVTTYFEKKRSLATGIAVCGSGFGTFIFAPLITKLLFEYGWRGAMLIIAAIVLKCTVFGALFRPLYDGARAPSSTCSEKNSPTLDPRKITLKLVSPTLDMHLSDHDFQRSQKHFNTNESRSHADDYSQPRNGMIQRPHSMGHFNVSRSAKLLENTSSLQTATNRSPVCTTPSFASDTRRLTLSQPMLNEDASARMLQTQHGRHNRQYHFGSQSLRRHGPMQRPDIFYQGSLMNIPSYKSRLDLKHQHHSMMQRRRKRTTTEDSTTSAVETEKQLPQELHAMIPVSETAAAIVSEEVEINIKKRMCCGMVPQCSEETKEMLKQMLDMTLLRDPIFILFTLSNFLTSIGFNVPYVYIVPRSKSLNLSSDQASILLAVIGIANTIGRIILGYLSDKPWVNRVCVYNWCLTICGVATTLSAFCTTYSMLLLYASVFGFTIGAYVGLTSVILVDLLGLERLTNAFGLLLLFQGIASLIGPPMAGALYDITLDYNPGFYLAGITIALSGVVLFNIPLLQKWEQRKKQIALSRRI